jgi:uncharacterized protein (DUF427 family)
VKDFLDQELNIGDNVIIITPNYRDFTLAQVIKFTAKNVRVKFNGRELLQSPDQLVRMNTAAVTKYLLMHSKT